MARVSLPPGQPGERAEGAGDPGPEHGRLRTDGEHVGADRSQRTDLGCEPGNAGQEREPERPERDDRDVAAAHREQVVEPARAEVLLQRRGQALVLTENDALEHGAPLAAQARDGVAREPRVQPVGDAAEAAAPADHTPRVGAQDRVHPVTA